MKGESKMKSLAGYLFHEHGDHICLVEHYRSPSPSTAASTNSILNRFFLNKYINGSKVQSFLYHKQEISDTITKIPAIPESLHSEFTYLGAGIPMDVGVR